MATTYKSVVDLGVKIPGSTARDPAVAPPAKKPKPVEPLGVLHGGPAARRKQVEVSFYAALKQGGGVFGIWWAFTHHTGWVEWSAFAVFYALNVLAMDVCYHRYFVHGAFETSKPMRYILAAWAQMGAYGSLLTWCADHRRHHAKSDLPGDVHSPFYDTYGKPMSGLKGLRHAHLGWIYDDSITDLKIYGKGLVDDPVINYGHRTRLFWFIISCIVLPALWGYAFGGWNAVIGTILIAGCLRMALALHAIALVNSVGHRYGSQRFPGHGKARNNWVVALIALGEGWHNNHHAHPRAANAGMGRYEFDPAAWVIKGMEKLGLIWNVNWIPLEATSAKK